VGVVRAISDKLGNYLPWQPTIAARLLGNGGKIEPYTGRSVACLLVLYSMKQFKNLPQQQGSHMRMQFGILPLQQDNSRHVHAVYYPATASDCRALVCNLRNCRCSRAATFSPRPCSMRTCHCSQAAPM
jgi:hypothetical protein